MYLIGKVHSIVDSKERDSTTPLADANPWFMAIIRGTLRGDSGAA